MRVCSPPPSSADNIGDLQHECIEDYLQLLGREGSELDDLFLALGLSCHPKHRAALNRRLLTGEKPDQFMLAALREGVKVHGFAHLRFAEEAERPLELLYLKVRRGSQKQDLASMLLKAIHTDCPRNGLDVRLDGLGTNEIAISLYRRHNSGGLPISLLWTMTGTAGRNMVHNAEGAVSEACAT